MKNISNKKIVSIGIIILFLATGCIPAYGIELSIDKTTENKAERYQAEPKYIEIELSFTDPEVVKYGNYWVVRVTETNHNQFVLFDLNPGKPVLPVNISVFELMFGSEIIDVKYENSTPEIIELPGEIAYCKASYDTIDGPKEIPKDLNIYARSDPYPADWVTTRSNGGLSQNEHVTFFNVRVYPVRYFPADNKLQFIRQISVNVTYNEPEEPLLPQESKYELLIIAPLSFKRLLRPLIFHKNRHGIKTEFASTASIYLQTKEGRDNAEKIKYFIKNEIEESGIKYVLLVGGRRGPTYGWYVPVRYSKVVPPSEQEYPEQEFLSDLYFADIYDGLGNFSSWDSNNDNIFSVWNETFKEDMDLYPDVYLGRLACINGFDVRVMVNKIIKYERSSIGNKDWFNNFILVAGDSYNDTAQYNEGELISEKAITLMPGFNPVRVYAREDNDINRETVNTAMNEGAGFAFFCGHGNAGSWSTHFPPATSEKSNWTTGYNVFDMMFLRNGRKLPIVVVGGCHNGEFDVTLRNLIKKNTSSSSKLPKCWAWWLTSKVGGGAIATIANTGLGTHGDGDLDNNSVCDYLEILDGWLELRFFELYGTEGKDVLGANHGETITGYMNKFLGDDAKMDVKMVQQWQLFGDPSLKIGGYD